MVVCARVCGDDDLGCLHVKKWLGKAAKIEFLIFLLKEVENPDNNKRKNLSKNNKKRPKK